MAQDHLAASQIGRLIALPAIACAADVTLTLLGQPAAYWSGDWTGVQEFNPAARILLLAHPMLFVAAALATTTMVALIVL